MILCIFSVKNLYQQGHSREITQQKLYRLVTWRLPVYQILQQLKMCVLNNYIIAPLYINLILSTHINRFLFCRRISLGLSFNVQVEHIIWKIIILINWIYFSKTADFALIWSKNMFEMKLDYELLISTTLNQWDFNINVIFKYSVESLYCGSVKRQTNFRVKINKLFHMWAFCKSKMIKKKTCNYFWIDSTRM